MFGINGSEFLILLVIAVIVVGPERLPSYAEQLAGWVRRLREFAGTARERVASELGEEVSDVDWASLDPRRYDPRRIVREALMEELAPPVSLAKPTGRTYTSGGAAAAAASGTAVARGAAEQGAPAPFDDEAT
ncbi:MAG TPA: Sec-independent protein translocase TatB [Actinotalea sp.]|jgi:sec-independent protein translocase protein TatB